MAMESLIKCPVGNLAAAAARLVLDAGLHRLPRQINNIENRNMRIIFWIAYAMDRGLALTLGRAPIIQDYDIATDRIESPIDVDMVWGFAHMYVVDQAELNGLVYIQLYSVQAQKDPINLRAERARLLADRAIKAIELMNMVRHSSRFLFLI
jgi:hypothetical protein